MTLGLIVRHLTGRTRQDCGNFENNILKTFLKKIKARLRDAYWDIYGRRLRSLSPMKKPKVFLFICKGNICRSPFAEKFARHLTVGGDSSFQSAGIDVTAPNPPPPAAVKASEEFGIQMKDHKSRPLTNEMMQEADEVLVMEILQLNQLKRQFPMEADKIYPLAFFENGETAPAGGYEKYNIQDPYGSPVSEFIRCYRRIGRCVTGLLQAGKSTGDAETGSTGEGT
jgi:protein-tyrosine phosphatase